SVRVARYQQGTVAEAVKLMAAMGVSDPSELRPWMLRRNLSQTANASYAELYERLGPDQLLTDPPEDWAAARTAAPADASRTHRGRARPAARRSPCTPARCRRGSRPGGGLRIDAVGTCVLLDHRTQPGGETLGALVVVRGEARILGVHPGQHHLHRAGAPVVAGERGTGPRGEPAGPPRAPGRAAGGGDGGRRPALADPRPGPLPARGAAAGEGVGERGLDLVALRPDLLPPGGAPLPGAGGGLRPGVGPAPAPPGLLLVGGVPVGAEDAGLLLGAQADVRVVL